MIVRAYRRGDEEGIVHTDVGAKEWGIDKEDDDYTLECLEKYEGYTFIDDNGIKSLGCFVPTVKGEYVFFVKDKRMSPVILKYYKKILDKKKCIVWTMSQPGQEKMHRFFGMVKTSTYKDLEIWVKR